MVNLSYSFKIKAAFEEVWNYFSHFENIQFYDPCVKKAEILESSSDRIGTVYDITTVNNGNEAKMIYKVTKYSEEFKNDCRLNKIQIFGFNSKIESRDEIILHELANPADGYNLLIEYKAEMSFKGVYWFITPFALGTLNKIAEEAEKGMKKRCTINWGLTALQEKDRKSINL